MSTACSSYREHAWKKGKCADCSQTESAHKVASSTPASTGPKRLSAVAAGRALFGGPAEISPKKPTNKPKISLALGNKAAVFGETVVKPTVSPKPSVVVFKASAGNKPITTTTTTTTPTTSTNTAPVNSVSAAFSAFGAKAKSTAPVKSLTGTTLNEVKDTPITTSNPSTSTSTSTSSNTCSSYIPHAFKKDTCRDCGRGVSVHAGVTTTTTTTTAAPSIDRTPSVNRTSSTTTPSKVTVTPATAATATVADTKIQSTPSTPAQQTPGHSRKSSQTIWNSPGLNPFNAPSVNRRLSTDYDELLRESRAQAAEFLATHSATASATHSRSPSTLGVPSGSDFLSQLSLASTTLANAQATTNAEATNANTASRPTAFTAPKAATNNNTTKPATPSEPKTTTASATAVKPATISEPKAATNPTPATAAANTCTSYAAHAFKKNTCMNCGKSESTHSVKAVDNNKPVDAKISTPPSIDRKMSIRDRVSSLGENNINLAALQGREYIPSTHTHKDSPAHTNTDGTPMTEIGDVDSTDVQHHGSFKRASATHKHPSTTRKLSFVPPKRTSTESVAPADITIVSVADTAAAAAATPPAVADATVTSITDVTAPDAPAPTVPGTEIKTETILTPSLLTDAALAPSRPTSFKAPRKTSTTTETTSVPTEKVIEKVETSIPDTQKTEKSESGFGIPNFHTDDDVPNFHADKSSSIRSSGLRDLLDDDDHSTLANKSTPVSSSQAPITTAMTNTKPINLLAQDDDWETD